MASSDITDNLTTDPLAITDTTATGSTDPVLPLAISLDQADADYAPGETVGITTTNVSDGGTFTFQVAHLSAGADGVLGTADDVLAYDLTGTGTPWTVTDGGAGDLDGVVNGSIQTSWYVNGDAANQAFMLTATDDLGNTATTTFTDAPKTPPTTFAYADTHIDITADNTISSGPGGAVFSSRDTAIFHNLVTGSSGTGNWSVFSQIQSQGSSSPEQGYNSPDGVLDEKTSSQHNSVILLNGLIKVDADGTIDPNGAYYAFRLDMHQTGANPFLSLDSLKIYQSTNGGLTNGDFTSGPDNVGPPPAFDFTASGTHVAYDMNAGGTNHSVLMDAEYDSGSGGGGDVIVLVPTANFNPANGNFLYFYSAMGFQGGGWQDTGTFEEWSALSNPAPFSVSGTKYEDLTGNGKTADDIGWTHGPVTIFIDEDNSGTLTAGDLSTTTDASGNWSIGGLTLADVGKSIYEVVPGGSQQTGVLVQTVGNPGSGGTDTGNDFTNFRNFSVSGTKYEDLTGNGKTADDIGWTHGPVTIFIDEDNSGTLTAGDLSTTTDASGNWSIGGLTLADVGKSIYEVVPGGSQQTGVLVQTVGNPGSGGTDTGNDFTNFRNFSVSGTKYEDLTGNGKTADDIGWTHGPVTIFIDEDNSGTLTAGDLSTTTDASGNWSIGGLTLADVGKSIYEVVPGGSQQTGILVQTVDNPGSSGTDTGNDFTNFRNFSVSGTKYEDLTGNGKTADDIGWTHGPVTIFIDEDNSGTLTAGDLSTTTDASGAWSIGGLTLADVGKSIYEVVPGGSQETGVLVQTVGNPGSGGTDTGNDFTNFRNFSVSGTKYEDLTGNGKTADDIGWTHGPVTIFIDEDNSGTLTAGDLSTTTDASGAWSIGGLTLADVGKSIYEVVPGGSEQTGILVQTVDNPGSGGTDTGNDFTNFRNFSVSGTKYEDLTGNGKTADDIGWTHGPVTIFIDEDNSGTLTAGDLSTTTDASGAWSIGNLTLADVGKNIYEVVPAGSEQTGILVQTVDNPGSGGTDTGNDFTNFRNFSVSGTKYEDLTGNGKTADDIGWTHGPVTIFIDEDNSGTLTAGDLSTTTDASGAWSIGNLTLADVGKNIYEVVPAGSQQTGILVQTVDNPGSGGVDTGNDFTNFLPPLGQGATPGFWKNHLDIVTQELDSFNPGWTYKTSFETIFGFDDLNKIHGQPSIADALGAKGGGVNHLERSSAAAFIAAAVNAVPDGPGGKTELNFSFSAATSSNPAIIAILNQIDTNHDHTLQPGEVSAAVRDVLNDLNAPTSNFGLTGQPGVEDIANAFDAMNNQPHPDASVFLI